MMPSAMTVQADRQQPQCETDKPDTLSRQDFQRLSAFIQTECGIKMPEAKKVMLEARFQKRLRILGMPSFADYVEYLFSPHGLECELHNMIDVVTTNKTDFFREPPHYDFLVQKALPAILESMGTVLQRKLAVWSAGCSTGEEPYTLAIVLREYMERHPGLNMDWSILATDISTRVLEKAKLAIFETERIAPIPDPLRRKYLMRSRDKNRDLVRIVPELRQKVSFRRLNFMDDDFGLREKMNVIFCRNVIIYFDRSTQTRLINKFNRQLTPGGYLFLGHSETLHGQDVPLDQVAPTVYRKPA
jgi:chemotaxis protein methyltransferase CheR